MEIEQLKIFIKERLFWSKKGQKQINRVNNNLVRTLKKNLEAVRLLEELTPNLKTDNLTERVCWVYNDWTDYPKHCYCGKPITFFKAFGYDMRDMCSCKCRANDPEWIERTAKTNFKKYGQSRGNYKQTKETCLKKYGVENAGFHSALVNKSDTWKDYQLPSGKIVRVQGYEPQGLDILLKEFDEQEIEMPGCRLQYQFDQERTYIPDFFIPAENLLVEIKSEWTWNNSLEKNKAKIKGALKAGFDLRLIIFDNAGQKIILDKRYRNSKHQPTQ